MNKRKTKLIFFASALLLFLIPLCSAGDLTTYLSFDGDDDSITIPNSESMDLTGAPSFTWEAWIYPETYGGGGYGRILDIFNINTYTLFFIGTGGTLSAQFGYNEVVSFAVSDPGFIPLNQWSHVVAVEDSYNFTLYVDTSEVTYDQYSEGAGSHLSSGEIDWYIGNRLNGERGFDGYIDEFRFYNRALSHDEIVYSYNNIEPQSETGLICWLRLNEATGSTATDETANNNDGTLMPDYPSNAPTWIFPTAQQSLSDLISEAGSLAASFIAVITIIHMAIAFMDQKRGEHILEIIGSYVFFCVIMVALALVVAGL